MGARGTSVLARVLEVGQLKWTVILAPILEEIFSTAAAGSLQAPKRSEVFPFWSGGLGPEPLFASCCLCRRGLIAVSSRLSRTRHGRLLFRSLDTTNQRVSSVRVHGPGVSWQRASRACVWTRGRRGDRGVRGADRGLAFRVTANALSTPAPPQRLSGALSHLAQAVSRWMAEEPMPVSRAGACSHELLVLPSKVQYKSAWNATAFQFWAAYLAPCLRAQRHDTPMAVGYANTPLALLGWTTLPAAASHYLALTSPSSCPECACFTVPLQFPLLSPRICLSHRKLRDRRQLMSIKALVSKKAANALSKLRFRHQVSGDLRHAWPCLYPFRSG